MACFNARNVRGPCAAPPSSTLLCAPDLLEDSLLVVPCFKFLPVCLSRAHQPASRGCPACSQALPLSSLPLSHCLAIRLPSGSGHPPPDAACLIVSPANAQGLRACFFLPAALFAPFLSPYLFPFPSAPHCLELESQSWRATTPTLTHSPSTSRTLHLCSGLALAFIRHGAILCSHPHQLYLMKVCLIIFSHV